MDLIFKCILRNKGKAMVNYVQYRIQKNLNTGIAHFEGIYYYHYSTHWYLVNYNMHVLFGIC